MTVEPLENGVYLSFGGTGLYYSIDDSEWVSLPIDTNTPSINVGQTIKIKGINIRTTSEIHFTINGRCKLSGTIMSILYGDKPYEEKIPFDGCFSHTFYNCTSIVSVAPDFLPATTLAKYCYYNMFSGCTSLTTAPELPATTLAAYCYYEMFYGCTSLVNAPVLPATTLVDGCYSYMFYGCSKLSYIKAMFTTTPSISYTSNWLRGVASSGTFIKNPNATWNVIDYNSIPYGWTVKTE